jgi:hypothetical protein
MPIDYSLFDVIAKNGASSKPAHRGILYENVKKAIEDRMMTVFYEQYPQLIGKVAHITSSSPLTNNFYLGAIEGEVST